MNVKPTLLLALLLSLACVANSGARPKARTEAALVPSHSSAPLIGSTLYLPIVNRDFDASYISPFGIVMYGNVDDASGLAAMRAAGSRWVTVVVNWYTIEPNAPASGIHSYDWSGFDTKVSNARAAGLDVFVLVAGNPSWAAALPGGPTYPSNLADLLNFVTAMVERYDGDGLSDAPGSPVVNYWSFYAEPDNGDYNRAVAGRGYWGYWGADYAQLLATVSPVIRAANPKAKVLVGGIAYDWFTTDLPDNGGPGPFVRSFLTDTLAALNTNHGGVAPNLDAVAFHFYPISLWRWPTIREKTNEIKGILSRHGAGNLPLIVPEMGFWSDPGAGSNETLQARRLVQMYVQGMSVGIQHLSWLGVFDGAASGSETHGLFRGFPGNLADPKFAYFAYQTMTRELAGARYFGPLNSAGAEGYEFTLPTGQTKTVVWSLTDPRTQVTFNQACVRLVDKLSIVTTLVNDGSGLDLDTLPGQVTVWINYDEPTYAGPCS